LLVADFQTLSPGQQERQAHERPFSSILPLVQYEWLTLRSADVAAAMHLRDSQHRRALEAEAFARRNPHDPRAQEEARRRRAEFEVTQQHVQRLKPKTGASPPCALLSG